MVSEEYAAITCSRGVVPRPRLYRRGIAPNQREKASSPWREISLTLSQRPPKQHTSTSSAPLHARSPISQQSLARTFTVGTSHRCPCPVGGGVNTGCRKAATNPMCRNSSPGIFRIFSRPARTTTCGLWPLVSLGDTSH